MKFKPFTPQKYRRRIFVQLWMLALQFVLGMTVNLIAEDASGVMQVVSGIAMALHALTALGLLEGAVYIAIKAPGRLSWWTAAATALAFGGGVVLMATEQDIWSFVMACGFIASLWLHGVLYMRADWQYLAGTKPTVGVQQ